MNTKRNIPFSPPEMGEDEIQEVAEALRSGWITTGPKTKDFEHKIAAWCHTDRYDADGNQLPTAVCACLYLHRDGKRRLPCRRASRDGRLRTRIVRDGL